MNYDNELYLNECKRLIHENLPEMRRIAQYPKFELEHEFLGFLEEYTSLHVTEDFVILDFGCNHGIQGVYFENHKAYIGVDVSVPSEWRMRHSNAVYFDGTIQDFIRCTFQELNLNPERCFAICSYVPDKEAQQMVAESFPYHKVVYCDEIISEQYPDMLLEEER